MDFLLGMIVVLAAVALGLFGFALGFVVGSAARE